MVNHYTILSKYFKEYHGMTVLHGPKKSMVTPQYRSKKPQGHGTSLLANTIFETKCITKKTEIRFFITLYSTLTLVALMH